MKSKEENGKKIATVRDEIVIDSADVRRAQELAVKRGKAVVDEELAGGDTVVEEIPVDPDGE